MQTVVEVFVGEALCNTVTPSLWEGIKCIAGNVTIQQFKFKLPFVNLYIFHLDTPFLDLFLYTIFTNFVSL